jgi:hypothetical protein
MIGFPGTASMASPINIQASCQAWPSRYTTLFQYVTQIAYAVARASSHLKFAIRSNLARRTKIEQAFKQ